MDKQDDRSRILFVIIITTLIVGGGVFIWQNSLLSQVQEENSLLENEVDVVEAELLDLQRKCCKGAWRDGVCILKTCIDSDVNEKPNDIYIKGSVTTTDDYGIATTVYDECTGTKLQVDELWCYESPKGSGNYVRGRMVYNCPKGCLDGACIQ